MHAKPNLGIVLAGLALGVITTVFLWNLGWIATLTFTIPILAFSYANNMASNFNKVMVDDK